MTMTRFDNFIGGEWVAGATTLPNINPSDTDDVIGHCAQADAAQTFVPKCVVVTITGTRPAT